MIAPMEPSEVPGTINTGSEIGTRTKRETDKETETRHVEYNIKQSDDQYLGEGKITFHCKTGYAELETKVEFVCSLF